MTATATTTMESLALTNYGHFTTMLVEDGRVRGLGLHLDRLTADCAALFGARLSPDRVRAEIAAAVAGTPGPVTVRVTVVDPALPLARPAAAGTPQLLVTTRPAGPHDPPPVRVRTVRYERDVPQVKHTGLFGPLHQRRRAQQDGYDDALFLDADGLVSEGVTWNIGFFDGDTVIWPLADALPGVTMRLIERAYDGPQRREPVGISQLPAMAAAFTTNAAVGIRAVAAVDTVGFDPGHPVLDALRRRYAQVAPEPLV
ncbi:aminotransferase class IV [Mangrovihabitans endophyticus]|nr:aminotransferase class IV [Mangrovihabitans endophyticus]